MKRSKAKQPDPPRAVSRLHVHLTPDEADRVAEAARKAGFTGPSTWARHLMGLPVLARGRPRKALPAK